MRNIYGSVLTGVPYKGAIVDGQIGCCCPSCPNVDNVNVILSGILACICSTAALSGFDFKVISSTINGAYTLPIIAPNQWKLTGQGAWDIEGYDSTDGSCSGFLINHSTGTFSITLICDPSTGMLTLTVVTESPAFFGLAACFAASGYFDDIFSNTIICSTGPWNSGNGTLSL